MGPHPAVAEIRLAVRRCLGAAGLAADDLVLAACSGGADSLALAAALAFEAPRLGMRGGGVTWSFWLRRHEIVTSSSRSQISSARRSGRRMR